MQASVGVEGGAEHSLEERKGFAVLTLSIYTLLCGFFPPRSTFKTTVSLDYPSDTVGCVLPVL